MVDVDYEQICKILTLRYDPGKKSIITPLKFEDFEPREFSNLEEKILHIIEKNLLQKQDQLKFDTVSLGLSGGIDSGLTLVMLRRFLPNVKINCISQGFGTKEDEVLRAKELARLYNCEFHEIIKENVLIDLPKLITIIKEPRWNVYNYYTLEEGKKHSDFFYGGDGGDELFGGYTFRLKKFFNLLPKKADWMEKTKLYLSCHDRDWVPDQEKMFNSKIEFSWNKIYEIFKDYFNNDLPPLNQVFLADFNGKLLYDWIPTNKAFEKFFGLKIESIFLSDNMIEFATHVPWQKKFDPQTGFGKLPLRSILKKLKEFENNSLIKKGFGTDLVELWDKNAKEIIMKYVNEESEIIKDKIISLEWLKKCENIIRDSNLEFKRRYIHKMFSLLALETWYRLFITKTLQANQKF